MNEELGSQITTYKPGMEINFKYRSRPIIWSRSKANLKAEKCPKLAFKSTLCLSVIVDKEKCRIGQANHNIQGRDGDQFIN